MSPPIQNETVHPEQRAWFDMGEPDWYYHIFTATEVTIDWLTEFIN